ncbi:hypothetical protein B9Z55_023382 [Caenorhabditis nigoni]|uniref:Uncharacterized protein n=1 Tax=Caenorhabditis nigoni TaxID=1611254 RepID=A0A2G5SPX9_9PELO|nr:hypothetical protein B9Z55_023382 [Caenorhabditis nigoni]
MPRPATEENDVRAASTTWTNQPEVEVYGAVEPVTNKSSMTTLQHPDVQSTPTMPKKVSFAAEVDEQQERISKEGARRDACCSIQ